MLARRVLVLVASVTVVTFLAAIAQSTPLYASVTRGSNNDAEATALGLCLASGPPTRTRGALWVSQVGSSYYNDTVTVDYTQRYVQVELRGSAVKCARVSGQTSGTESNSMDAHYIDFRGTYGSRFGTIPNSRMLNRGDWTQNLPLPRTGQRGVWTTRGGSIEVRFDTQGLAMGPSGRQTITVPIYRCPRNASPPSAECYASNQEVNIVRLPPAAQWEMDPTATITSSASAVGDTITWRHRVTNTGTNTTNATITYRAQNQGYLGTGVVAPSPWTETNIPATGTNYREQNSTHVITAADVGQTLCRRTTVTPVSSTNLTGTANSPNACITIPFGYNLMPSITDPSAPNNLTDGDARTIPVAGMVRNMGPTKSALNINWQLSRVKYAPGTTIANRTGGTGAEACTFLTGQTACTAISQGTEGDGYGYGTVGPTNPIDRQTYSTTADLDDDAPGTKTCFVMSVQGYTSGTSDWRHSALHCYVVGKAPKVQIWGGDVIVGRGYDGTLNTNAKVQTGLTVKLSTNMTFGSWSEYGIFAPATISFMASGSGLNGGNTSSTQTSWSAYSFTRSGTTYGQYNVTNNKLPDVTESFPTTSAVAENNFNLSTTGKGRNIRPANPAVRNITLTANPGNTLGDNQWLVINAIGHNVTIANNLIYANGSYTDAKRLPQLIILADNITINSNVTQVDAWLIAKNDTTTAGMSRGAYGSIATCDQQSGSGGSNGLAQWLATPDGSGGTNYDSSVNSRLTLDHCTQPLRINGPVMASKLYLRRTAGSGAGAAAGDPAEVINLRPDAYLWAREHMSPSGIYQTVNTTELPPRY